MRFSPSHIAIVVVVLALTLLVLASNLAAPSDFETEPIGLRAVLVAAVSAIVSAIVSCPHEFRAVPQSFFPGKPRLPLLRGLPVQQKNPQLR